MPVVKGILETALYVSDLGVSQKFYERLFGFRPMLRDNRMCGLEVPGRQVLLLFVKDQSNAPNSVPGGTVPPHDGAGRLHLAFRIDPDQLSAWKSRLSELGIPIETEITPPQGGVSLYFRDPDDHLIELATPGLWPFAEETR